MIGRLKNSCKLILYAINVQLSVQKEQMFKLCSCTGKCMDFASFVTIRNVNNVI